MQKRAARNLRRHSLRVLARLCVLLAADIGAFVLLRSVLRFARHHTYLAGIDTSFIRWMFADGYLGGWQFAVALVVSLIVTGNYGPGDRRRSAHRLFAACALAVALPLWQELWRQSVPLIAGRYIFTVAPAFAVLLGVRLLVDWTVARVAPHPSSGAIARTILVGHAGECIEVRGRRAFAERSGFDVRGYVDVQAPAARGALGSVDEIERILLDHHVEAIVLCGYVSINAVTRVVRAAMRTECQVLSVARRYELAGVRPQVLWRRRQPFIELRAVALRWHQLLLKRGLDVAVSALMLAVFSPIMLLLWAAVRLESPGPGIFGQRRLGLHGRSFTCYKFRSMYVDAEERLQSDPALYQRYLENDYKLPDGEDTRITRIGRFLRKSSLDELPQLWNVLRGEMSLVGPRPVVPKEIQHYNGEAPLLLTLKPGITGSWQVNGRSTLQYPERAAVELEYVERWSLLGDIAILLKTVPAVLSRRGAH